MRWHRRPLSKWQPKALARPVWRRRAGKAAAMLEATPQFVKSQRTECRGRSVPESVLAARTGAGSGSRLGQGGYPAELSLGRCIGIEEGQSLDQPMNM